MNVALVTEGVVIVALLALIGLIVRWAASERAERAVAYEKSLQTMADRIQAPERLPMAPVTFQIPELEDDDTAMVGTIAYDERYGQEDE